MKEYALQDPLDALVLEEQEDPVVGGDHRGPKGRKGLKEQWDHLVSPGN